MIDYLINNHDFRMAGSYDLATHTILDSDYKKSEKCLTFLKHSKNGVFRFNFYKKFEQIVESLSVSDLVGSQFGELFSNPNNNLKNATIKAKDTCLLRLEIIFL